MLIGSSHSSTGTDSRNMLNCRCRDDCFPTLLLSSGGLLGPDCFTFIKSHLNWAVALCWNAIANYNQESSERIPEGKT